MSEKTTKKAKRLTIDDVIKIDNMLCNITSISKDVVRYNDGVIDSVNGDFQTDVKARKIDFRTVDRNAKGSCTGTLLVKEEDDINVYGIFGEDIA